MSALGWAIIATTVLFLTVVVLAQYQRPYPWNNKRLDVANGILALLFLVSLVVTVALAAARL